MTKPNTKMLLLVLTIGVFGILNTEMGVVGLIPYVAERFGVSVPDAGMLVSGFALVVAFAGPTMPLLFSGMNRKSVMMLSLGIFSLCNIVSIFAPSFEVLLAARVVPAAFHPLYVSMAMAVAQQSGETPEESAKASARVFVGVSAGMVVGAPVAGMLASAISFPVAMGFFAAVTILALALTMAFIPSMPVAHRMSYGSQVAILKSPFVLASLLAAASVNAAMFGFYSFMADYLGSGVRMGAALVSGALLAYGLSNIAGNVVGGNLLAKDATKTMLAAPPALALGYAVLVGAGAHVAACVVVTVALGIIVGAANTANQFMVSRSAPEAPDFANGLFLTATNLGTTVGTALCGSFIAAGGAASAVFGTFPCLALGLAFIIARVWLGRQAR